MCIKYDRNLNVVHKALYVICCWQFNRLALLFRMSTEHSHDKGDTLVELMFLSYSHTCIDLCMFHMYYNFWVVYALWDALSGILYLKQDYFQTSLLFVSSLINVYVCLVLPVASYHKIILFCVVKLYSVHLRPMLFWWRHVYSSRVKFCYSLYRKLRVLDWIG